MMEHKHKPPIENSIKQQLEANRSKNLLYENVEQIIEIEPGFLAALEELLDATRAKNQPENIPSEVVSFAAQALLKRLYAVNQYLSIGDQQIEELKEIYRQTWLTMLGTGNVRSVLRQVHYPALSRWLAALYPKEFRKHLRSAPEVGGVVYEEYSARLQIELLQIDVAELKQPVLDIGCGSHANLVRHLRSLGIAACGFDRQLEIREPYLAQSDWFEYPFEPGRWGSIVSNMAFTNHLNYAYRHDVSRLESYLLKMKEILAALAAGGSFYYAPGLPFVEDHLAPERYKVEREQPASELFVSIVTRI
jgi:hypothetical protein